MRQLDGSYAAVQQVVVDATPRLMYNLTVAEAHTFFIGEDGWLVHNAIEECQIPNALLTILNRDTNKPAPAYLKTEEVKDTVQVLTDIRNDTRNRRDPGWRKYFGNNDGDNVIIKGAWNGTIWR